MAKQVPVREHEHSEAYAERAHAHEPDFDQVAEKEHAHPYALGDHEHGAAPEHEHDPHDHPMQRHSHGDLLGQLRGAVRAMLTVFEAGAVNSEQVKAVHAVRVIIGDAHGTGCLHENVAYEEGDHLVCQDCRAEVKV